jgi:hypothetical protein
VAALVGAAVYFSMGISGLHVQPVELALKETLGQGAFESAFNLFVAGTPWFLKPLFGLLCDRVPLFGLRRKPYLLTGFSVAALSALSAALTADGAKTWLVAQLAGMTLGLALVDVAIDGILVEGGRRLQATRLLQSAAWISMKGAMALASLLGGWFAATHALPVPMAVCAGLFGGTAALALFLVREEPAPRASLEPRSPSAFTSALRDPAFWTVALFLLVGRSVPSLTRALFYLQTDTLHLAQTQIGLLDSLEKGAAVVGGLLYLPLTRRWSLHKVLWSAIAFNALTRWGYLLYVDFASAALVEAASGVSGVFLLLAILDLAARTSPKRAEASCFAILMACYGVGLKSGTLWGSWIYERAGFHALAVTSGLSTLAVGLLLGLIPARLLGVDEVPAPEPDVRPA